MRYYFAPLLLALLLAGCANNPDLNSRLTLLGGPLPGSTATLFSPGLVSVAGSYEFASTFNPDATEFYYTFRPEEANQIYVTRSADGAWSTPEKAPFSTSPWEYEPHITPDGSYIYWGSIRPMTGDSVPPSYPGIWRAQATESGWGEPVPVDLECMMYVSADNNHNLYYTHVGFMLGNPDGLPYDKPLIVYAREEQQGFSEPVIDMKNDTALYPGAHPCISPDGSYIIFDSPQRSDTYGGTDLYISFRLENGAWSEAVNMGPMVNTEGEDMCASLTPGGDYIMFARFTEGESDIFWISSAIIGSIRSKIGI